MLEILAQEVANEAEMTVEIAETCAELGPFCDLLLQWTGNERVSSTVAWVVGTPLKIVIIAIVALLANRFARRGIARLMDRLGTVSEESTDVLLSEHARERATQRADTIGSLLRSLSTGLIFGIAVVMILDTIGIPVMPIIASAGVLGLAVGFGAQSVIEDFLRGIFMLGEDQFGVGDRVDLGAVNGFIERVTLRTTVVKDPNGTLWHIPNSEINHVANESQEASRAVVEVNMAYAADIDRAMEVLAEAAAAACADPEWSERIKGEPAVRGVQDLNYDKYTIRVQVWVDAGGKRQFQRHLRKYIKEGLERSDLPHPNDGYDIWMRGDVAA